MFAAFTGRSGHGLAQLRWKLVNYGLSARPPRLAGWAATVLAHQGGWDEALLVAGPLLLFAGIIWNAKRRAVRQSQTQTQTGSDE